MRRIITERGRGCILSDSGLASVTAECSLSDGAHDLKRRRSSVVSIFPPLAHDHSCCGHNFLMYSLLHHACACACICKHAGVKIGCFAPSSVPLALCSLTLAPACKNPNERQNQVKIFLIRIRNTIASTNNLYNDCSNRPSEHSASQPATAIHYCLSL